MTVSESASEQTATSVIDYARLERSVDELRDRFDKIIFDSPPLLPVTDRGFQLGAGTVVAVDVGPVRQDESPGRWLEPAELVNAAAQEVSAPIPAQDERVGGGDAVPSCRAARG